MIQKILVPKLGQTMEEATVEKWRKHEGDTIHKGDVVLEITTDKATLEVESFVSGTLRKILAPEGVVLPVNTVVALVGDPNDELPDDLPALEAAARGQAAPARAEPVPAATATPAAPAAAAATPPIAAADGRIFISPRARKLAAREKVPVVVLRGTGPNGRIVEKNVRTYLDKRKTVKITPAAKIAAVERGVDVALITGTGPGGRITREDVLAAPVVTPLAPAPAAGHVQLSAMRRVVAERMSLSKREAPHFYLFMDADMTETVAVRNRLNQSGPVRIGFHDILIRACALALAQHPAMNAAWDNHTILRRSDINIGLAVAIDEGLIVPVLRNADRLALPDIARQSKTLIDKARAKKLIPDEYEGGCLTLSNLGMFGVDCFVPIINPGEAAILGVGRIAQKAVVIDRGIHVRAVMTLSLSADHRVVDGAIAAAFLQRVKQLLEAPDQIV